MAPTGLELIDLSKRYGSATGLDRMTLDVLDGEFVTLLGPSGSGKTTCLRLIAGLLQPDSGDVRIRGRSVVRLPIHKRNVGMVFQGYALFPHMTVRDNVAYPLRLRRMSSIESERRLHRVLELVQLDQYMHRYPNELSGGEQQRVAIARALVFEPSLLLLDEPLAALDRRLREHMKYELRRIHQAWGVTTVYVTHDQEEALALSDRIVVLDRGVVQQVGTPREVYRHSASRFVTEFLGEANIITGKVLGSQGALFGSDERGRPFPLPKDADCSFGQDVTVSVRAENVRLKRVAVIPQPWMGTIELTSFLGDAVRYVVSCPPHQFAVKIPQGDSVLEFDRGDVVALSWKPSAVQLLR